MLGVETIAFIVGAGLCVFAALALVSWSGQAFASMASESQAYSESVRAMREAIRTQADQQSDEQASGSWSGYRDFVVTKVVRECADTTSLYLEAADGKPIATFRPGQHITLRFPVKGKLRPLVRCYSLSDSPGKPWYRITVKHHFEANENPQVDPRPGLISTIINTQTQVGDRIAVKSPSGHFCLDEDSEEIAVLIAGGVGITPMISMLERIVESGSQRPVVIVHGVGNRGEQAFADHLRARANQAATIHCVNCYSRPTSQDIMGTHYQHRGYVSVDLLKSVLPNNECQFYICGNPEFNKSISQGLLDWGVAESRIAFEQFGPASIGKTATSKTIVYDELVPISFTESGETILWSPQYESILELAEAHDVPIESGCRSGSCGTCEAAILSGKVRHQGDHEVACGPGRCLPCIAIPDGALELEV